MYELSNLVSAHHKDSSSFGNSVPSAAPSPIYREFWPIGAQGTEAGGHWGRRGRSTLSFLPVVADLVVPDLRPAAELVGALAAQAEKAMAPSGTYPAIRQSPLDG
jgi:hypothetical protein